MLASNSSSNALVFTLYSAFTGAHSCEVCFVSSVGDDLCFGFTAVDQEIVAMTPLYNVREVLRMYD